ncbi:MAG: type VI secretion system tube protein TssD [Blastocatellia bacterium]
MNKLTYRFTTIKLLVTVGLLLVCVAATGLAQGEEKYRLRVDITGIGGEGFGGGIDAIGTDQLLSMVVNETGVVGRAKFEPIVITKAIDSATPRLFDVCAGGDRLHSVTINWIRSNHLGRNTETIYFKVILEDVQITSIRARLPNQNDSKGQQLGPVEDVAFKFGRIRWVYTLPNGATINAGYDLRTNRGV